jgi:excisionase family DNA binding protein
MDEHGLNRPSAGKAFYRVAEVASIIGLCRSATYKLVADKEIPSVRLAGSRSIRVPAECLRRWIERQEQKAGGAR